ncbi:MAG: PAS domain S-box protein [Candidatus Latescibacteria bacterium]|jgi:diguanylate cyclase (GGDEF)-like protein/PAS domain S-box-containing protein|nr:PAS domain S-box protein [Candidatus Latescibacterota bacterium]
MDDKNKTKARLINELADLRKKYADLKAFKKERKKTDTTPGESEEKFKELVEMLPELVYETDDKGMITFVNKQAFDITGYTRDDFEKGFSAIDLIVPEDRDRARQNIENLLRGNNQPKHEYTILRKDGSTFPVIEQSSPIIRDGKVAGLRGIGFEITERKRTEDRLKNTEERFRSFTESTIDCIWELDGNGVYTYVSPSVRNILGYDPEEVIGKTPFDFMPPEEKKRVISEYRTIAESQKPIFNLPNVNKHKDKRLIVIETSGEPFWDIDGNFCGYRGINRDITERKRAEETLKKSEAMYRSLFENMLVSFAYFKIIIDNNQPVDFVFLEINSAFEKLFKLGRDNIIGKKVTEIIPDIKELNGDLINIYNTIANTGEKGKFEIYSKHLTKWFSISAYSPRKEYFVAIFEDITERKRVNQELQRLSLLDGLTGISNRRNFDKCFDSEWKRALRRGFPLSMIMIDIDFFKAFNDSYGHQTGDNCLIKVASSINNNLKRSGDFVARFGGEEFVVILPGSDLQGATAIAETLRTKVESLKITHAHSKACKFISISLGVASTVPTRDSNPKQLLAEADKALYNAKHNGRNRVNISEYKKKPNKT